MTTTTDILLGINRYILGWTAYTTDKKIDEKIYKLSGEIMDKLNDIKENK
ncbi:hypothetical protein [Priestia megaterium]